MKKYIFYNGFVLVFLAYYLISSGFIGRIFESKEKASIQPTPQQVAQNAPYPKEFINCIFNMEYYGNIPTNDSNYAKLNKLSVENHISRYKNELNFNALHIYSGASTANGGFSYGGGFEQPISEYRDYFNGLRNIVSDTGIKGIYGRAKIEMPCYFQCVEYEVKNSGVNPWEVNYGFCFDYTMPNINIETDSGRTVLHAPAGTSGYLCKNIYENLQHSDFFDWGWNDGINWKIRPMLRIDSNYVDQHPEEKVLRIDIIKYNGNVLDSIIIRARNFAKFKSPNIYLYNGNYIDNLDFELDPDVSLLFSGKPDTSGLNDGWSSNWQCWNDSNHVDFRIFTYGNTDVWFDKLTVLESPYAEKLFHGDYDSLYIKKEVSEFTDNKLFSFFADEITYSCFKSVKYVKDKIRIANQNARFYFAMTNYFGVRGMRTDTLYYQAMADIINPECFATDVHLVMGPVPEVYNTGVNMEIPYYWKSKNYDDYNLFIQNQLLGDRNSISLSENYHWHYFHIPYLTGSLVYQTELARRFANKCSPKSYLFVQPQIHSNMMKDKNGDYDVNREPTNEEIRVQACVALAHGADGLSWFTYHSFSNKDSSTVNVGMLMLNDSARRHQNYYNQDKWDSVAKMNAVLLSWKPTLDATNWTEGFSVHSEGSEHNFIKEIRSKINDLNTTNECVLDLPGGTYDCAYTSYWEMGFFDPINTASDKSKYLLMVNRRCSPKPNADVGGESPDVRTLYLRFKTSQFQEFTNWKIIDIYTGVTYATFTKNDNLVFFYSGVYQPGEGKLLKIVPVMQEGGTLACNEEFNTDVTLKKSIYNNGFNITMGVNTNITFADSAGIYMTGGDLTIGSETGDGPSSNLYFQGVGGNAKWQGFILENCGIIKVFGAHFNNILPNQSAINIINCYHYKIENNIFTCAESENSNGVNVIYNTTIGNGRTTYHYIKNNTLTFSGNPNPAINVISNAGTTTPVII